MQSKRLTAKANARVEGYISPVERQQMVIDRVREQVRGLEVVGMGCVTEVCFLRQQAGVCNLNCVLR